MPSSLERLAQRTRARIGAAGAIELRLPRGWPDTDGKIHWHARSGAGALHAGSAASVGELPEHARRARVHVWTPPSETVLTRVQLPTRSRAKILQALPYALEDQLVDDPEKLHFAYAFEADGALAVAITARARINAWTERLHAAGIRPASMCPATLALPWTADAWSIAFGDDEIWMRTRPYSGGACSAASAAPPPLLVSVLQEAAAQTRAPRQLIVLRPPPDLDADAWTRALGIPVSVDDSDVWGSQTAPPTQLNLLQGDYAPSGQARQSLAPLRPAAIMLALLLVAAGAVDIVEWIRLKSAHSAYTAEMQDIYAQSFPGERPPADAYTQMVNKIEALQSRGGGPADMLPLLTRVAPLLAGQSQIKLNGLKYAERSLTLQLVTPNFGELEGLANRLRTANLTVEMLPGSSRANEVEGQLRVQPAGAGPKPRPQRS